MVIDSENMNKIYNALGDETSKDIFSNRLMFSLTGDGKYVKNIVRNLPATEWLKKKVPSFGKAKFLFGAGVWGKRFFYSFSDLGWNGFVDNYHYGCEINGLPVISFQELCEKHRDAFVFVSNRFHYDEIENQLYENGFPRANVLPFGSTMEELFGQQYFDLPFMKPEDNEIFVDMGTFDGDSIRKFVIWCKGQYDGVYGFEPNPQMWDSLKHTLADIKNCQIENKGVWNKNTIIRFVEDTDKPMSSHFEENPLSGGETISVTSVDEVLQGKKVTFLKADIEGAEFKALEGAQKTIKQYKPKIAFSIYHKPEDILELPLKLLEYRSDYKLYLRHYSFTEAETVLYAF